MPVTFSGGLFDRPEFGKMPEPEPYTRKRQTQPFEAMLEVCRQHPNQGAKIGAYKAASEGGRQGTAKLIRNDEVRIRRFLRKHYPLEDWQISTHFVNGTWGDRELWVMYRGDMTAEEAERLEAARKLAYSQRIPRGATAIERREHRLRARAELEMEENRLARRRLG